MKKIASNLDEYMSHVFQKDETSVVLKSHLFLEQAIDGVLSKWVKNSEIILKNTFKNKVDFLYSIGILTKEFRGRLLIINKIRNKFSHEYGYKLSKEDILHLFRLGGVHINVPDNLISFPSAEESILFASAVALLIQPLQMLDEIPEGLSRQLLQDAIDKVLNNSSSLKKF